MQATIKFHVGLDVHKDSIAIAHAEAHSRSSHGSWAPLGTAWMKPNASGSRARPL